MLLPLSQPKSRIERLPKCLSYEVLLARFERQSSAKNDTGFSLIREPSVRILDFLWRISTAINECRNIKFTFHFGSFIPCIKLYLETKNTCTTNFLNDESKHRQVGTTSFYFKEVTILVIDSSVECYTHNIPHLKQIRFLRRVHTKGNQTYCARVFDTCCLRHSRLRAQLCLWQNGKHAYFWFSIFVRPVCEAFLNLS